ncbi:Threonine/homoserine exporter RhtA [Hyella patelloides LEGE 07179]|uniref:Threonine/homoserine exporter RhtA n=1 Tax=Hyella patelloides LEGE 07179 TaxID=945734 RepID=A0A563VX40_9CYAN|nr:EamA family transporter [Hyella patelloides]VEP16000.1 Threonine/homoserine exporter RhtA [Hyella patelloides LEGE 07179]
MQKLQPNLALPPPTFLVLISIASTQLGSAFAKSIIQELGATTTVLLRVGLGAIFLLLLQRPQLKGYTRANYLLLILFGLDLAAMNYSFYAAINRIPLGIAVTLEFVGPLGVACANSRQLVDLLWIFLAGVGIFLLAPVGGSALDPWGVALALVAGFFWGTYILLSARVGKVFAEIRGLSLLTAALAAGTIGLLPLSILSGGLAKLEPRFLAAGLGVAILSSAIPYTFELEALKKLPIRVFGVLMSLEPGIATVLGFIILREKLELRAIVAVILVTLASVGTSVFEKRRRLK